MHPPAEQDLLALLDGVGPQSFDGDALRQAAVCRAAERLVLRLERPWDALRRWMWQEPTVFMAVRVAVDLDIFSSLDAKSPQTAAELAASKAADARLVDRLCRTLASAHVLAQPDAQGETYGATATSHHLATPEFASTIRLSNDVIRPLQLATPAYLEQTGWREPQDPAACPWQAAMGTELTFFPWLKEHPPQLRDFRNMLQGFARSQPKWTEFTDVAPWLEGGGDSDSSSGSATGPFLVDVGGSTGHDIAAFRDACPQMAGRLVCQDLAPVVAIAPDRPGIAFAVHDFFTPQPVKGARVYFFHSIFHDWPDEQARQILEHTKAAMAPGYSKVVVQDRRIPLKGGPLGMVGFDMAMLAMTAARERTQRDWDALFAGVGMRVTRVHESPLHDQAVFEVELL